MTRRHTPQRRRPQAPRSKVRPRVDTYKVLRRAVDEGAIWATRRMLSDDLIRLPDPAEDAYEPQVTRIADEIAERMWDTLCEWVVFPPPPR